MVYSYISENRPVEFWGCSQMLEECEASIDNETMKTKLKPYFTKIRCYKKPLPKQFIKSWDLKEVSENE